MKTLRWICSCGLALALAACPGTPTPTPDGGTESPDAGSEAPDAGDSGTPARDGGADASDGGLDLNDVSFLFPLPAAPGDVGDLLSVGASGLGGPLLPRARYDQTLYFAPGMSADALYAALRVVSVRVDPCFPRSAKPEDGCAKQLRLVAQPVVPGGGVPLLTLDAPIHLLYELSDAQFREAHRALFELKRLSGGLTTGRPLDVHPTMRAQGLKGPYAQKLKELILASCGPANLVRIASMPLLATEVEWRFAAIDVNGVNVKTVQIPRLPPFTEIQSVIAFGTPQLPAMSMTPAPTVDAFRRLLDAQGVPLLDAGVATEGLAGALTLENPDLSSVHQIDCGSCHLATRARREAERTLQLDSKELPGAFHAPRFDLSLVDASSDDLRIMRAFGYFGPSGAWNQRTINESARVAERLSVPPGG